MKSLKLLAAAIVPLALLAASHVGAQDIPALKIRIADSYTKEMPSGVALAHFAKRISELSGGKMTAQLYSAGTLYSEDKGIQAVLDGTVDMGLASAANHSPFTKVWRVVETPYLFRDNKQFRDVIVHGEIGKELRKRAEKDNLVPLMIFETGGFRILGTNIPVRKPDDIKGLKIRTPQSPVPLAFWKAEGANPTVVPWGETYLALASRTVDGLDASWLSWPLAKLWEVTKHITTVGYSSTASVVDVSTKWWAARTPKQKEIILKAAKEAEDVAIKEEDMWEARAREMCIKNGMTVYDPTPAEMAQWQKLGRTTWSTLPDVSQDDLKRIGKLTGVQM